MTSKKTQVVMLPSNEKAYSNIVLKDNKLQILPGKIKTNPAFKPQHLYFLSDEKIKEGDWRMMVDKTSVLYGQFEQHRGIHECNDQWKKIITTTDISLKQVINDVELGRDFIIPALPQPSQDFIKVFVEEYNKGNVIEWVDVEYDIMNKGYTEETDYPYQECNVLKVNSKNEIAIEQFREITKINTEMGTRNITPSQAQTIIDIACPKWKDNLFTKWGKQIVLKEEIEITEEFYQAMRKACTPLQNILFDEIFGKDHQYKVGGWAVPIVASYLANNHCRKVGVAYEICEVSKKGIRLLTKDKKHDGNGYISFKYVRHATEEEIAKANFIPEGTPCLVRDFQGQSWRLVYSNGDGKFTGTDNLKSIYYWGQVQVLDIHNLPKE